MDSFLYMNAISILQYQIMSNCLFEAEREDFTFKCKNFWFNNKAQVKL